MIGRRNGCSYCCEGIRPFGSDQVRSQTCLVLLLVDQASTYGSVITDDSLVPEQVVDATRYSVDHLVRPITTNPRDWVAAYCNAHALPSRSGVGRIFRASYVCKCYANRCITENAYQYCTPQHRQLTLSFLAPHLQSSSTKHAHTTIHKSYNTSKFG